MAYENKNFSDNRNNESIYSKRIRAGKRRTYFFDVRSTRGNDYFITITESKKRFDDNGYERHKMFLYKEDFNKFINALTETVDYVKTELMPDFDFDAFNHDNEEGEGAEGEYTSSANNSYVAASAPVQETRVSEPEPETSAVTSANDDTAVDDWKI
ncbi:MAG: PUR family DNA/RNA-binding protein [Taibaiella sp.]|nr:PUR family DNA/RNA-binding protein [Taibaiella sp.]